LNPTRANAKKREDQRTLLANQKERSGGGQRHNKLIFNALIESRAARPRFMNVLQRAFLEENEDFSLARMANVGQPLAVPLSEEVRQAPAWRFDEFGTSGASPDENRLLRPHLKPRETKHL
jgi:hypothetical protein